MKPERFEKEAVFDEGQTPPLSVDKEMAPLPPTSASVKDGKLKDTPANRALKALVTPNERFVNPVFVKNAYYSDGRAVIFHGDAKKYLQHLIDCKVKVNCIITSPPYYGQRDYGTEDQLGHEDHPQQFIDKLVDIFRLCWEVLHDTGSLWVNIGDTYWSGKGEHKSGEAKQSARRFGLRPQDKPGDGKWTKPKQLLLIPHRLAIALQEQGWLVRNDNVWVKPNPVPDQVRDRSSISHEYVFHFTKERWYYYNREEVGRKVASGKVLPPLDTWEVPPASGKRNHRASFSHELVRIPILSTTPPNGIVLDPFNGVGTSMIFARMRGFRSVGIDVSSTYCEEAAKMMGKLSWGSSEEAVDA